MVLSVFSSVSSRSSAIIFVIRFRPPYTFHFTRNRLRIKPRLFQKVLTDQRDNLLVLW